MPCHDFLWFVDLDLDADADADADRKVNLDLQRIDLCQLPGWPTDLQSVIRRSIQAARPTTLIIDLVISGSFFGDNSSSPILSKEMRLNKSDRFSGLEL
jgi:hypothetical protein